MGTGGAGRFDPELEQRRLMQAEHDKAEAWQRELLQRGDAVARALQAGQPKRLAAARAAAPASSSGTRPAAGDDGFVMGMMTGVPIPLTPASIAGAAIHDSITSSTSSDSSSCSSSSDSSSSGSSYDSGSSCSSSSSSSDW